MSRPLILLTNDDGIDSVGLWAAAEALQPLGELLIVAPDCQWSGAGRSMPYTVTGALTEVTREVAGQTVRAYAIDASPALCSVHAIIELAPRLPDLAVAGINFGENLGSDVTISGTVGAVIETAASGIPGLAISLQMPIAEHFSGGAAKDYTAAQAALRHFARLLLTKTLPYDVDLLNINVPADATESTPWRLTRLSRSRYFITLAPNRASGDARLAYTTLAYPDTTEPDSDIWAVRVDGVTSVTPISLDLTSRAGFGLLEEQLRAPIAA